MKKLELQSLPLLKQRLTEALIPESFLMGVKIQIQFVFISVCCGPWMAAEPYEAESSDRGGDEHKEVEAAAAFQSMKFSYQQQSALYRPDQPKTKETHGREATLRKITGI